MDGGRTQVEHQGTSWGIKDAEKGVAHFYTVLPHSEGCKRALTIGLNPDDPANVWERSGNPQDPIHSNKPTLVA